jgi:tRNA modification GTPase
MSLAVDDTIVALASAPGGSYEGIIRLSGPEVVKILRAVWKAGSQAIRSKTAAVYSGALRCTSEWRDDVRLPGLLYLWPTARSYTRQPLAEMYLPGSAPLLDLAIRSLCQQGARVARPGEFTLRAFLAGRLDLTQAEAVLGVIEARDVAELQTALTQLAGGLSNQLAALRNQLLDLLAHLEAGLDFVDEDIEFITREELQTQIGAAAGTVQSIAAQLQSRSESSSAMPRVVLIGEPNAGKSSLLNALAGSSAALVSPMAGTTRDYLVKVLQIGARQIQLIDTAGVEASTLHDAVAADAQLLGHSQHQQADLQLLCIDASQPLSRWVRERLQQPRCIERLIVWTKCDAASDFTPVPSPALLTSSITGQGLTELRAAVAAALDEPSSETRVVPSTAVRASASLHAAAASLAAAADLAAQHASEEWIAAELRLALDELGQVLGTIYTDDILDRVFSRFCIGK